MTEHNGNGNRRGFLIGAVVGAAVGAGIALLVAPRTGKDARSWLARSTRQIKHKATNALEQARETVNRESKGFVRDGAKEFANVHDRIR